MDKISICFLNIAFQFWLVWLQWELKHIATERQCNIFLLTNAYSMIIWSKNVSILIVSMCLWVCTKDEIKKLRIRFILYIKFIACNLGIQGIPSTFWYRISGTKIAPAPRFRCQHFIHFFNKMYSQFGFVPLFFLLFYLCSVCIKLNRRNTQLNQRNTLSSNMLWWYLYIYFISSICFGKKVRINFFAWLTGKWEKWTWMPFVVYMKVRNRHECHWKSMVTSLSRPLDQNESY
jgi:hypothetical protein